MDKVYVNVDRYGNTSAASIPIALDEAIRAGRIGDGATVMFVGLQQPGKPDGSIPSKRPMWPSN